MKILLIVWTICSSNVEYREYRKTVQAEILNEDSSTNVCLNNRLYKAHADKDAKKLVFLVALYHEWKCELPEVAAKKLPSTLDEHASVDDLIKMVEKEIK